MVEHTGLDHIMDSAMRIFLDKIIHFLEIQQNRNFINRKTNKNKPLLFPLFPGNRRIQIGRHNVCQLSTGRHRIRWSHLSGKACWPFPVCSPFGQRKLGCEIGEALRAFWTRKSPKKLLVQREMN